MSRFQTVVAGISCIVLIAVGLQSFSSRKPAVLFHGSDPTMPSALTVGAFGFDSGDNNAEAPLGATGTGCLFLKQSLCEHPVSFNSNDLWRKGNVHISFQCSVIKHETLYPLSLSFLTAKKHVSYLFSLWLQKQQRKLAWIS